MKQSNARVSCRPAADSKHGVQYSTNSNLQMISLNI